MQSLGKSTVFTFRYVCVNSANSDLTAPDQGLHIFSFP